MSNSKSERLLGSLRGHIVNMKICTSSEYKEQYYKCFKTELSESYRDDFEKSQWTDEVIFALNDQHFLFSFDETLTEENRIKSGSYYTPIALVEVLWRMACVQFFANKGLASRKSLYSFFHLDTRDEMLYQLIRPLMDTLIKADIAGGTGQMIAGYMTFISALDHYYNKPQTPIDLSSFYLADNRVDALECALLMSILWQWKGLSVGMPRLILGDSLSDEGALSETLKGQSVDILIGNPPYLGEKNNRSIFETIKKTSWGAKRYEGKMDLFYFFVYKGLELLKSTGTVSYITTNYFVTADGAKQLRAYLRDHSRVLAFYQVDHKVFKSAPGQDNCLFTLAAHSTLPVEVGQLTKTLALEVQHDCVSHQSLFTREGNILIAAQGEIYKMIQCFERQDVPVLDDLFSVKQGLVSGFDRYLDGGENKPGFVFEKEEIKNPSSYFRPFYKNSDIYAYTVPNATQRSILYITTDDVLNPEDWEWKHLNAFRETLMKRREFKEGKRPFYALHWQRTPELFQGPKLIVPQRSKRPRFAFQQGDFYASADVYFIKDPLNDKNRLLALMVYLNSQVSDYYFYHFGKRKGNDLELYATPLSKMPLPANPLWIETLYPLGQMIKDKGYCTPDMQEHMDQVVLSLMDWDKSEIEIVNRFAQKRRGVV